jgi:hypothetical protein
MNLDMIRRLLRLNFGLLIYGLALSMVINAKIGVPPWEVFAQGISIQLNTSYRQRHRAAFLDSAKGKAGHWQHHERRIDWPVG